MSEMYRMDFSKEVFNALIHHLNKFEENRLIRKIKSYATVAISNDGKQYISVRFFGDELQDLCWYLMVNLPLASSEDHFSFFIKEIEEREAAYQRKKEEEAQALYEGIKKELVLNPNITGAEIARKMKVPRGRVYDIWNQVRADIELEKINT